MSETKQEAKPSAAINEDRSFLDLLNSLMGQVVTMVNPESYEDAPVGHQMRAGFYRAKPVGMGKDYLIIATEYIHTGREAGKEPVRQYIPLSRIKRISIMKGEKLIHI